jgi:carboxyl-terminal processing protease
MIRELIKHKAKVVLALLLLLIAGAPFCAVRRPVDNQSQSGSPVYKPSQLFAAQSVEDTTGPNSPVTEIVSPVSSCEDKNGAQIDRVCSAIYRGDFNTARQLLSASQQSESAAFTGLINIISEYEAIQKRREETREAAYREQLAELKEFSVAVDSPQDALRRNDVNDVNDVNDILKVLAIITRACEFADEQQKQQLLSDSFTQQVFQKAIDQAAQFEAQGKWLDAYINCYSWLHVIEPNNEGYSDHAQQLLEKANIVASFQDSPCETRKERYEGVKKQMFARAIDALHFNYVSVIDYSQLATEAIKRCRLLAEVAKSSPAVREALGDTQHNVQDAQYGQKLAVWSALLGALSDEVDQSPIGISKDKFIDVFEKVLTLNTTTAQLPHPALIAQFAEAALSALDPYTVMVWPKQSQDFEKIMTNEFTGIGIEISKQKGLLTVVSLLPDTPAYRSGLDAGDVIEAVDGVQTKDMTLICAVRRITGPAGTNVKLTVRCPGEDKTQDITITRARITVPTTRGWKRTKTGKWLYMIDRDRKIGYVRVTSFSERTADDLEKVLLGLEMEGLKGLILDLRFNSGGLLEAATAVTDKFLKEGRIVSTHSRFGIRTYISAHEKNTHPDYPLVVLINSWSASASEIVAGALEDPVHNRAILVGERTHGKGSVQGVTPYPGGGAQLKYTMAHYHLPSGQRVESRETMEKRDRQDWGVAPNIEIELRTDELKKMTDVQRDNDVLVKPDLSAAEGTDHKNNTTLLKKHTVEETLEADPQLAIGVLVIKTKLIELEAKSEKLEVYPESNGSGVTLNRSGAGQG